MKTTPNQPCFSVPSSWRPGRGASAGSAAASRFPKAGAGGTGSSFQFSSLSFCHSKHHELEQSLLKVINGRELLEGTQLWHGLAGAMEGAVFTFQPIADDFPPFSGLLFLNGCLGVTGIPGKCMGEMCFCHSEAGLCLKAAGRIRRGFLPPRILICIKTMLNMGLSGAQHWEEQQRIPAPQKVHIWIERRDQ